MRSGQAHSQAQAQVSLGSRDRARIADITAPKADEVLYCRRYPAPYLPTSDG